MLVIQLTWERFLATMQKQYPAYTQAGLARIYAEYEADEEQMPDEDIRVDPVSVTQTFRELKIRDFTKEELYPQYVNQEIEETSIELREEIKAHLGVSRFMGFTHLNTVVFRRN